MRTLLITEWFRPDVGGSITWYENVYSMYPRADIFILSKKTKGDKEYDKKAPFVIERVSYRRYPFLKPESLVIFIASLWKAFWMSKRHKIELVHCDKVLPAGLVAFYLKKLMGIPYITYCHGEEVSTYLKYPDVARKMAEVYNNACRVIVNSSFTRNLITEIGVEPSKIVVIHPGVDVNEFRPGIDTVVLRKRLGIEGKKVLLTVGRLQKRKGHDMVIKSMPQLLKIFQDLVYVIASDGEEMEYLRKLAADLGVKDRVIFTGRIGQDEMPVYFNMCDVFIMANRTLEGGDVEGFGIVFLEANACGKAVIGGKSGGVPDAVLDGHSGVIIDGTSEDEIVTAVSRLLSDPLELKRMGVEGLEWSKKFTWDNIASAIKALENMVI